MMIQNCAVYLVLLTSLLSKNNHNQKQEPNANMSNGSARSRYGTFSSASSASETKSDDFTAEQRDAVQRQVMYILYDSSIIIGRN